MAQEVATVMIGRPGMTGPSGSVLNCLVVDDEANIRTTLGLCLETLGHEVREAASAEDAMQALADARFDVAFVDIRLGTSSGLDLMTRLVAHSPRLKVIVITAYASVSLAVLAMGRGAMDFLCKPFTPEQVTAAVMRVAELQALEHNVGTLQDRTGTAGPEADFATASAAVQHAVTVARQAAPSQTPILIVGEVGTGMRVLGRAIHGWSNRSDGPFRSINCSQRSPAYVDLALFGQSYVGDQPAVADRPSMIDEAEGGTLVVGHIEALSAQSQLRLLRVIEKREYEVPGAFTMRSCDVRIVATAAPFLEESGGPIHAQLMAALQRVSVALPPLRQRVDDIPMLAQRYLAYVRQVTGKTVLGFGSDALELLRTYSWPGNLHELREVVAKAVAQCNGAYVEPHHLPVAIRSATGPRSRQLRVGDRVSLREVEEQHIRAILATSKSLHEAAEILEIDSQALYRRRKQFGI